MPVPTYSLYQSINCRTDAGYHLILRMIQVSDLKEEISRLEQLQETKVLDEKLVLADKQCQLMEKKALDSQHKAEVADQRGQ